MQWQAAREAYAYLRWPPFEHSVESVLTCVGWLAVWRSLLLTFVVRRRLCVWLSVPGEQVLASEPETLAMRVAVELHQKAVSGRRHGNVVVVAAVAGDHGELQLKPVSHYDYISFARRWHGTVVDVWSSVTAHRSHNIWFITSQKFQM